MNAPRHPPDRMLAKASESVSPSGSEPPKSFSDGRQRIAPDARPESVLDEILSLLEEGEMAAARQMAVAAARRFPQHPQLQNAQRALAGKATVRPGHEPNTDEEFEWLRRPPESARGKWVALSRSELVAAADTPKALFEVLRAEHPTQRVLIARVE